MPIPRLVLIRGLPGSGKSTLARKMLVDEGQSPNDGHFEADMYFIMRDGEYHYNPALVPDSHLWCQTATKEYIDGELGYMTDLCVVSNTFTTKKEMKPYIDMAKAANIKCEIIHAQGNYKNIHNVPDEVIQRMKERFEE